MLPSEWHDTSLPPHALLFLQNPVTEVPRGGLGGHRAELHVLTSAMALNHSLQLNALRQRGRREASYSLYHVSPQAAQKPAEAAGDLSVPGSHSAGKQGHDLELLFSP